ncbi:hypothetical protein CTAYLR_005548 [Chrysophaeum taylorii]|uniref:AMP-dependent synthetase/ligase domain-containing protein n=1 Tax=Chrysophaeum taylorii TaxID=2483200 RepID=A0AAD7ULX2_9STRA|nr:hypothetical protein CTAYLR_005548 [Chrysophaeum taylorii]
MTRGIGDAKTLHELGVIAGEVFGSAPSIGSRVGSRWVWVSFAERARRAKRFSNFLKSLNVDRGDRVAVISKNSVDWVTAAYGCYGAGAVHVPMYEQQSEEERAYILNDSGAKVAFDAKSLLLLEENITAVESEAEPEAPLPADLAALIYTSGTTGKPKGVELTHANLLWNALEVKKASEANIRRLGDPPVRTTAILPWAHVYGQTCELHCSTAMGVPVAISSDPSNFLRDLKETKPTFLIAVPAVYERIRSTYEKKRKESFFVLGYAMGLALRVKRGSFAHFACDQLFLSKVRGSLGGEIRGLGTGGAAISPELRRFFDAVGLPIANGYGLTETSPVLTTEAHHDPRNYDRGSVGKPLRGVRVKSVDGELVVSSPGVMRGYWNNPTATSEVLHYDDDGLLWFKTGDLGVIDENSYVRVVGRVKERYKLANGKYVVPTPLEYELAANSRWISQIYLYGENKPHNVALVAPDWAAIASYLKTESIITLAQPFDYQPRAAIDALLSMHRDEIHALIAADLASTAKRKSYRDPKKWALVVPGFTLASGMLTPKLSLKRNAVYKAHEHLIDSLYSDTGYS